MSRQPRGNRAGFTAARRQSQFFDDIEKLPEERHGVKDYFPMIATGTVLFCAVAMNVSA